jgi:hypothetical protein
LCVGVCLGVGGGAAPRVACGCTVPLAGVALALLFFFAAAIALSV